MGPPPSPPGDSPPRKKARPAQLPEYPSLPETSSQSYDPPSSEDPVLPPEPFPRPSTHSPSLTRSRAWNPDQPLPSILVISTTGNVEGGLTLLSRSARIYHSTPGAASGCIENIEFEAIWVTDDILLDDPTYKKTTEKIKDYVGCGGTLVLCGVRSSSGDINSPPTHPRRWLKEAMDMEWRYPADDAPVDAVIMRFARDMIPPLWKSIAGKLMKVAAAIGSLGYLIPQRILELVPVIVVLPGNPPVAVEREELHGPVEARMDMRLMPPGLYVVRPDAEDINQDVQTIVSTFILDGMSQLLQYDWSQFVRRMAASETSGEGDNISRREWEQYVEGLIAERNNDDLHEEGTRDDEGATRKFAQEEDLEIAIAESIAVMRAAREDASKI